MAARPSSVNRVPERISFWSLGNAFRLAMPESSRLQQNRFISFIPLHPARWASPLPETSELGTMKTSSLVSPFRRLQPLVVDPLGGAELADVEEVQLAQLGQAREVGHALAVDLRVVQVELAEVLHALQVGERRVRDAGGVEAEFLEARSGRRGGRRTRR